MIMVRHKTVFSRAPFHSHSPQFTPFIPVMHHRVHSLHKRLIFLAGKRKISRDHTVRSRRLLRRSSRAVCWRPEHRRGCTSAALAGRMASALFPAASWRFTFYGENAIALLTGGKPPSSKILPAKLKTAVAPSYANDTAAFPDNGNTNIGNPFSPKSRKDYSNFHTLKDIQYLYFLFLTRL